MNLDPWVSQLEQTLQQLPLEWFVFLGSFLEEVIAPIPSPFVMTTAGVIAQQQGLSWMLIFLLAVLGAVGKTLASWFVYLAADKGEDLVVKRYGKYLGVSHAQVEKIGRLFDKGWLDEVILIVLRATPIIPSVLVSVVSGVIKLRMRTYLLGTFLGTLIRNLFYLGVGIYGLNWLQHVQDWFANPLVGLAVMLLVGLSAAAAALWVKNHLSHKVLRHEN